MPSSKNAAFLKSLSIVPGLLLVSVLASSPNAAPQARTVNATIDTSKTGAPISKYIYGQFLEHGGDIVNTGVWSEMLVDRKFFYPVASSAPTPPPVMGNAAGNPRFHRTPTRWWAPIGGDDVVTMDTKAPYTGDQTPLVKLDAKEPRGIQPVRYRGSQRQGLHRTHCARRPSRLGGQGHAHLGQRGRGPSDRHHRQARRRLQQVSRFATPLQPTPMTHLSKSPAQALAPFMSGRFHSCPPTISKASAPRLSLP